MKKITVLGVIAVFAILLAVSCGTPPEPEPEVAPVEAPVVVDTTPTPEPPPPPPPPKLKAEQLITVYFDFDKFDLRDDTKAGLDQNYDLMKEFPNAIIKIEGHCDERGTVEYNVSLGEKRAKAAMDYLVNRGIAANRLSIISYGKEKPVDPGHNEAAWAKNRRCEFKIISQ
ncbi:MAG TPA: peptidoglycan-associated lipoprotein Pal [candidate division Zixibacteria bacterium]|nr:peptidoglycan-associated lipoprotein Pal [candidate division Zixibacteria bacterium]